MIATPRMLLACCFATTLALPATAQIVGYPDGYTPVPPATPPRHVHDDTPEWIVGGGYVYQVATGQLFSTYTGCGTGPILNPVANAINRAAPGDDIHLFGPNPGIEFVPVKNPCNQGQISWGNGDVVRDIDVVGKDVNASIDGIFIHGDYTQPQQGGIDRLTFQGIRLRNPGPSFSPLQSTNTGRHGLLRVYDCLFEGLDLGMWSGHGMKFCLRLYLTSLDIRGCYFMHGAEEHNVYIDSPGFDGVYDPSLIIEDNHTLVPTGRTGIQVVNRIYPIDQCNPHGGSYVGGAGKGTVLIRDNTLHADASAGGGSTVTVAGHHGNVWIQDNHITAEGGAGGSVDTGGIVAWTPCETWLTPDGYSTIGLIVIGNTIVGNGTRPNVAASGCKIVWIGSNSFTCAGNGVEFNQPSAIANGDEFLPLSTMAGWLQGGVKAKDTVLGAFVTLTDHQIDTRY